MRGRPEEASQPSALEHLREHLRGLLSQPVDPRDPLSSLAPLVDSLRSAREVGGAAARPLAPGVPTPASPAAERFPGLGELLAGDLPRGKLVEVIGARSSGRFSTVLAALAAATAAGEVAALVDLGDGLDPRAAIDLGVDLDRLLWLRPASLKQALAGAEIVLGGGFPTVVLDLGNPPVRGGRGVEAAWLRLARAAQAHGAALLVASPYRVSGTAAAAVLRAARGRARWVKAPWLLDGLACQVTLEKYRGRQLPASALGWELRLSSEIGDRESFPALQQAPRASGAGARTAAQAAARTVSRTAGQAGARTAARAAGQAALPAASQAVSRMAARAASQAAFQAALLAASLTPGASRAARRI